MSSLTPDYWSSHSVFKQKSLVIPPERDAFIKAKAELDRSDFASGDELKKLLMRRALQDIPIILSLQNEGNSIEKLYKKGMLTDDMHFKVKQLKDFVDEEFQQVKDEADELMEGWGEQIWPQAMQFYQMLQKQNAAGKTDEDEEGEGEEDNEDKTEADGNKKKVSVFIPTSLSLRGNSWLNSVLVVWFSEEERKGKGQEASRQRIQRRSIIQSESWGCQTIRSRKDGQEVARSKFIILSLKSLSMRLRDTLLLTGGRGREAKASQQQEERKEINNT